MIEINIRLKIDTNDPREAYLQAMGALAFSGHDHVVSDYWLINGKPLPKQVAQNVRRCNGRREVTKVCNPEPELVCEFIPGNGVAFVEEDWRDKLRTMLRGVEGLPELRIDHPEEMFWPTAEAMEAFNRALLGAHFNSEPEYTPMFQSMLEDREVNFDVGEPPNCTTPLDFDVGTAEDVPLSGLDVEIYDLLKGLRQAE